MVVDRFVCGKKNSNIFYSIKIENGGMSNVKFS